MERLWIWTLILGLWLMVAPWVLRTADGFPIVNDTLAGTLIAGTALRGIRAAKWEKRMGRFWKLIQERHGGYEAPLSAQNGGRPFPRGGSRVGKGRA